MKLNIRIFIPLFLVYTIGVVNQINKVTLMQTVLKDIFIMV